MTPLRYPRPDTSIRANNISHGNIADSNSRKSSNKYTFTTPPKSTTLPSDVSIAVMCQ